MTCRYCTANKEPAFELRLEVTLVPNTILSDLHAFVSLES